MIRRLKAYPATPMACTLALALFAITVVGCGKDGLLMEGVHTARDDGPSTAQNRVEFELVPDAQLIKQSTKPIPNGTFVFDKGVDRLLVISNIISYGQQRPDADGDGKPDPAPEASGADTTKDSGADKPDSDKADPANPASGSAATKASDDGFKTTIDRPDNNGKAATDDAPNPSGPRYDKFRERVWITIPFDAELGKPIDINELDQKFLVGYDVAELVEDGRPFVQNAAVLGTIVILKDDGDTIDIKLDMSVTPAKTLPAWSVHEKIRVTVTKTGIHATPAKKPKLAVAPKTGDPKTGDPEVDDPKTGGPKAGDPKTGDPKTTDPKAVEVKNPSEMVKGQWRGGNDTYKFLMQFDEGGNFVYASRRAGDAPPAMKYGTWKIHGKHLVMYVKRYEINAISHMRFLPTPMIVLRHSFTEDGSLGLVGSLRDREGDIDLTMEKATYPDMNRELPPKGQKVWGTAVKKPAKKPAAKEADKPAEK